MDLTLTTEFSGLEEAFADYKNYKPQSFDNFDVKWFIEPYPENPMAYGVLHNGYTVLTYDGKNFDAEYGYKYKEELLRKVKELMGLEEREFNVKKIDDLSPREKDDIYRYLWKPHVEEDIRAYAEEHGIELTDEAVDIMAYNYVYRGDYDCNLSYWDNIERLIDYFNE